MAQFSFDNSTIRCVRGVACRYVRSAAAGTGSLGTLFGTWRCRGRYLFAWLGFLTPHRLAPRRPGAHRVGRGGRALAHNWIVATAFDWRTRAGMCGVGDGEPITAMVAKRVGGAAAATNQTAKSLILWRHAFAVQRQARAARGRDLPTFLPVFLDSGTWEAPVPLDPHPPAAGRTRRRGSDRPRRQERLTSP